MQPTRVLSTRASSIRNRATRSLALACFGLVLGACASGTSPAVFDELVAQSTSTTIAETTTVAPTTSTTTTTTTPTTTTTQAEEVTQDDETGERLSDAPSEVIGELLLDRDFDDDATARETAELLLEPLGLLLLARDEGQCAIDQFAAFPPEMLEELTNLGALPSSPALAAVHQVASECKLARPIGESLLGGMVDSGGSERSVDIDCYEQAFDTEAVALLSLTGNRSALEWPESLGEPNVFLEYMYIAGGCINLGQMVQGGWPGGLEDASAACLDEWGVIDMRVVRLLAETMSEQERYDGFAGCLTEEEIKVLG